MAMTGPTVDHKEIRRWADRHKVVPTEALPCRVDHEPTVLRLMPVHRVSTRNDLQMISWADFFARFDLLGLAFVYDDEEPGYNELLQRDDKEPHVGRAYRTEMKTD